MRRARRFSLTLAALPSLLVIACGGGGATSTGSGGSGSTSSGHGGGEASTGSSTTSSVSASSSASTSASSSGGMSEAINTKPAFIGVIASATYEGSTDDLLTAGLGASGLASSAAPPIADPAHPTPAELRRLAIYTNYRALVDTSPAGGFGVLFGPSIDTKGAPMLGEGKIAGTEHIAYADDGTGRVNVTMMVQIPSAFDPKSPCIVTATSSGSRGVYGAIGTAGEWGLKHGCAVAYTDKGTGNGVHDLQNDTVNRIDGVRADAKSAGAASNFTAALSEAEKAALRAARPDRFAVKHAHSEQNPERDWGKHTLQAIDFAFYVLNEQFGDVVTGGGSGGAMRTQKLKPANTIVIASSASNGAGAALAAAEQDTVGPDQRIDGVAVAEPQIQLVAAEGLTIKRGSVVTKGSGSGLLDYVTLSNLYQPCAALAARASGSPGASLVNAQLATNRCASLHVKGLLTATTTPDQAEEALSLLLAHGYQPESNLLHASHYALATLAIAVTYANAYGRFSVKDDLCGLSFAGIGADLKPKALDPAALAKIFATGNGIPPSSGVSIINDLSVGGPLLDGASVSPSTGVADLDIDGALCLRDLVTGNSAFAKRVQAGIGEVRRTGNLHGRPAVIVHGRSDALVPVAHTSRPYFGVNQMVEGSASKLSYIEVENAQHFDAFIDNPVLPGYDARMIPLHRYFLLAMDQVYAHLKGGAALPPSQVVRTTPRGGTPGAAPPLAAGNVPPSAMAPAAGDRITYDKGTVTIPD